MHIILLTAFIVSFVVTALFTKIFIPILHRMKFGQQVREEGPDSHMKKQGTPTMGGVVILAVFTVLSAILLHKEVYRAIPIYILTVGFGLVGFLDDYIKIVKKRSMGLSALQKLGLQFFITAVFYAYITRTYENIDVIILPFLYRSWDMGWLFAPFVFLAVLGTVNGANFTDGLDGLLSSVSIGIIFFFAFVAQTTHIEGRGFEVVFTSAVMIGVLLGFLLYNVYPAKVFMGDTGSLSIGGFVAAIAIMTRTPLFIVIVGFIYFFEILSVMIQVTYFKITKGKRIFKMTPIHHHFELSGMEETRVVYLFTVISIMFCIIGIFAL